MTNLTKSHVVFIVSLSLSVVVFGAKVNGTLMTWHKVTLSFEGPNTSESANPNPFRDYRLDVTFTGPSGQLYRVPGYYAADGDAAQTSANAGDVWQVHFPPDEAGTWTYRASFVKGQDVAANLTGGTSAGFFDGQTGSFKIVPTNKPTHGRDFRGKGKLVYTGTHYLQFLGSGDYFIKAGANSPEVLLEYQDFDNTPSDRVYAEHMRDWRPGDPTWQGDKGKGIIGVVNYLASVGMNSHYFLTMNHLGDGKRAWPFNDPNLPDRYDCSKLAQWEILFEHFDRMGMMMQFVLTETESESYFEIAETGAPGGFSTLRKIYYREMVARFGHHLAITWNLGEESGWDTGDGVHTPISDTKRKQFADYLRRLTYYRDHIAVHNGPSDTDAIFYTLTGHKALTGPSVQWDYGKDIHGIIAKWRRFSIDAGHPWVISMDEAYINKKENADVDTWRRNILWGSYMAGGAGAGFYIGSGYDLRVQNYRNYKSHYHPAGIAATFFNDHVPFHLMEPDDAFADNAWALKQNGVAYLLYLQNGGSARFNLPKGRYSVQWFDPRHGGDLQTGTITDLQGGAGVSIGNAPNHPTSDWAVLIKRKDTLNVTPQVYLEENGVVMMEVESAPLHNPGPWREETATKGYSGSSYYVSRDHDNVTDVKAVEESTALAYRVYINQPGNYRLGIRNFHGHAHIGEDNDCWTRLNRRPWIKTWSHRFQDKDGDYTWTWETGQDIGHRLLFPIFEDVTVGEHTLYIGVRSANWCIDRLYLIKVGYDRDTYYEHPPHPYGDYDRFDSDKLHRLDYPSSKTK